ncbi:DUF3253 domain-containing protein [Mariniluteicoccus flavus]
MSALDLDRAILGLIGERDAGATICPSEVARGVGGEAWRDLMSPVREAAARLADAGVVEVTQRGGVVDVRTARGPVRLRRGPRWAERQGAAGGDRPHWLLPVNPAAHAAHLPADWRERPDAGPVWRAVGESQAVDRWCLRTGFRTMRPGDTIWAYLSQRQELCAVGAVREVVQEAGAWFVLVAWDAPRTEELGRRPLPRSAFGQVPMSVCRAGGAATRVLDAAYAALIEE